MTPLPLDYGYEAISVGVERKPRSEYSRKKASTMQASESLVISTQLLQFCREEF
jgi:hypothetical protein